MEYIQIFNSDGIDDIDGNKQIQIDIDRCESPELVIDINKKEEINNNNDVKIDIISYINCFNCKNSTFTGLLVYNKYNNIIKPCCQHCLKINIKNIDLKNHNITILISDDGLSFRNAEQYEVRNILNRDIIEEI